MNRTIIRMTLIIAGISAIISTAAFAEDFQYHPKEKEFVKTFIELLPDGYEHKNTYIRECKPKNNDCYVKQLFAFAEGYCKMLDSGMSRKDVFISMDKFFEKEEAIAMVDAGIYIICPNHKDKLGK